MDKNKIKNFSIWARNNLLNEVRNRAYEIGIMDDEIKNIEKVYSGFKVEGNEKIFQTSLKKRNLLIEKIKINGFHNTVEEVASTWFIRIIGLRYMEVNEYLPIAMRILSSRSEEDGEPQVLSRVEEVTEKLELDKDYIRQLEGKDQFYKTKELYKHIIIKQCNKLGHIIPQMFKSEDDYCEVLLPDNLLQENSIIRKLIRDIDEQCFKEGVEVVGWFYQYYISQKKDRVFNELKRNIKISKENIPAATQLFTPKWIVKYMVENSLGRLWIENHHDEKLKTHWKYYIEEGTTLEIKENICAEQIKVLDPCMGAGHILIYAFELLHEIYTAVGYHKAEITKKILRNNIYGLDIDDTATKLSAFALIMTARKYDENIFNEIEKEKLELNLCSIQETKGIQDNVVDLICEGNSTLKYNLEKLIEIFRDGKDYGSIIKVKDIDFNIIENRLKEIEKHPKEELKNYNNTITKVLPNLIKQGKHMTLKYDVCITNPPYMGLRGVNAKLAKYLNSEYPTSKYDMFSVYMEVCRSYIKEDGFYAMINPHSWMFLRSFAKLREEEIHKGTFVNMLHLGARAFEENVGTIVQNVAFVYRKTIIEGYTTKVVNLTMEDSSYKKENKFIAIKNNTSSEKIYDVNLKKFMIIPTKSLAYWIGNKELKAFSQFNPLGELSKPRQGIATSDNKRFLRKWFEVDINHINFNAANKDEAMSSNKIWFPYNKGGDYRKWYGNNSWVINWEKDGEEVKSYAAKLYKSYSRTIKNEKFFFRQGLTYTFISESMGVRYCPKGFIFDVAGSSIFLNNQFEINIMLGFLCSKVAKLFLDIMNPTYNIQVGDIKSIPLNTMMYDDKYKYEIDEIVRENIEISKEDWDSVETSWDFKKHPLISMEKREEKISDIFHKWGNNKKDKFKKLKLNEERLNHIFIHIYSMDKYMSGHIEDSEITLRNGSREMEIKSLISYGVGCVLGRYAIEEPGVVYGGGDFNKTWNIKEGTFRSKNTEKWTKASIIPKEDNVIFITENEIFKDDLASRFIDFIEKVYGTTYLEDNLNFIAKSIGKNNKETSTQCIRRYLFRDFQKDHMKFYHGRPIYWIYDFEKNKDFKVISYIHRYDHRTINHIIKEYASSIKLKYVDYIEKTTSYMDLESLSSKERINTEKKIYDLSKKLEKCIEYEKKSCCLEDTNTKIDLSKGIEENYKLFNLLLKL